MNNATIRSVLAVLASVVICTSFPVHAASRSNRQTDDSVCDLGVVHTRDEGVPDFVRAQCKNGQVLMGSGLGMAGLGYSSSNIAILAQTFCTIAGIQVSRIQVNDNNLVGNGYGVRCIITKLP